jgi:hypothetical protein
MSVRDPSSWIRMAQVMDLPRPGTRMTVERVRRAPTEGSIVSSTSARHRKSSRSAHGRPDAGRPDAAGQPDPAGRHRRAASPNKHIRIAVTAVAGAALIALAWPAATHWMNQTPHPAGTAKADVLGLPAAGTHRGAVRRPARSRGAAASQQVQAASQQSQLVSVAVATRPGRHGKPDQARISLAYRNPLRGTSGLVPERVDQGVDFSGSGPVYALGDGVVINATDGYSTGWPGGGWISYRLTDGPDAGLVVYLAEDVTPTVAAGQHVSPTTVIGNMFDGADGIETGWAQSVPFEPESQLPQAGGIGGGGPFPTRVGLSFEELLRSLGVPAATNVDQPASGLLPPNYPAS